MTIYDTIYKEYRRGIKTRKNYPLHNGAYKLREVAGYPKRVLENIDQLIECRQNKKPLWSLHAADQVSIYIKAKPKAIAFELGYYVLPAIKQLHADGVPREVLEEHLPIVERKIKSALEAVAEAEWELKVGKIKEEYNRFDVGDSILFTPCNEYLGVIKYGLSLLFNSPNADMRLWYFEV